MTVRVGRLALVSALPFGMSSDGRTLTVQARTAPALAAALAAVTYAPPKDYNGLWGLDDLKLLASSPAAPGASVGLVGPMRRWGGQLNGHDADGEGGEGGAGGAGGMLERLTVAIGDELGASVAATWRVTVRLNPT